MKTTNAKVLLLENIHKEARKKFLEAGYEVELLKKTLDEKELTTKIEKENIQALGIRSKTQMKADVFAKMNTVRCIGTFCVGTDQVDLDAASKNGIAVFNAPYSNTRSVAELTLGLMIILNRNCYEKAIKLREGIWEKSAEKSYEIRGKKLGIIGYGHIGSQISVMAENLGMKVVYFDIQDKLRLGNTIKCSSLRRLLSMSDIITVHIDGRKENTGFIGEKEFNLMKKDVIFLNLSRGAVVDLDALLKNIHNGKIRGAAIDVFPEEPTEKGDQYLYPLRKLPNVILTPHIGGATEEAQKDIGAFVTDKIINFLKNGETTMSVNIPEIQAAKLPNVHRITHLHENTPGILAKIDKILARNNLNIEAQYLKTKEQLGYAVTDYTGNSTGRVSSDLNNIQGTIRFNQLY